MAISPLHVSLLTTLLFGCASRSTPEADPARTASPSVVNAPSPTPTTTTVATTPTAPPTPEATSEPKIPTDPFTLLDEQGRPIEIYPPLTVAKHAPIVVALHATCMQPSSVCDAFGSAGRDGSWLVCPSGNSTCAGEPDWNGPGGTKAAFLAHALSTVDAQLGALAEKHDGVLLGWSRGAYAARDMLYAQVIDNTVTPGPLPPLHARFRGLVLIAAAVTPSASKLRAVGIERVVMAAGDYDGSSETMKNAVKVLRVGGMEAKYVSLGKIAHVWPSDFEARMRVPIAWAAGQGD